MRKDASYQQPFQLSSDELGGPILVELKSIDNSFKNHLHKLFYRALYSSITSQIQSVSDKY